MLTSIKNRAILRVCLVGLGIIIILGLFLGGRILNLFKVASVEVVAIPAGSEIRLGNAYKAVGKLLIKNIQAGVYQLTVSKAGFLTYAEKIEVKNREKVAKEISLRHLVFNVKVDSDPKKADYLLILPDGTEQKGKTPFEGKIPSGNLKIKLSLSNYNVLEKEIFLDKDYEKLYYLDPKGQLVHHFLDIEAVPSAKGAAFSPDGKEIWLALLLNKKRGVSVFSSQTGERLADIDLAGAGGVEIIFSSDGSKAYVSQMETAKVFEIDTKTRKISRVFDTKSAWTKVLELSEDEKTIFASNWSGNNVSEIDLQEGKVRRLLPTVKTPRGLYATENGAILDNGFPSVARKTFKVLEERSDERFLYVAGFDRGEIQKIDLKTGKEKVIYESGGAMRHIVGDEEKGILYVSDMGKNVVWQLSLKDDKVKKFVDTDTNPNTIVLSPDKKILFVSCRGKNASASNYYIPGPEWGSVLLFDVATGEMLDAIIAGNQPTALDVSKDGKFLVFSDFLDAKLKIFEVPSYEALKQGSGGRSKIYRNELKK